MKALGLILVWFSVILLLMWGVLLSALVFGGRQITTFEQLQQESGTRYLALFGVVLCGFLSLWCGVMGWGAYCAGLIMERRRRKPALVGEVKSRYEG